MLFIKGILQVCEAISDSDGIYRRQPAAKHQSVAADIIIAFNLKADLPVRDAQEISV